MEIINRPGDRLHLYIYIYDSQELLLVNTVALYFLFKTCSKVFSIRKSFCASIQLISLRFKDYNCSMSLKDNYKQMHTSRSQKV